MSSGKLSTKKQEIIETPARMAWKRFRRHKLAMTGMVVLLLVILVGIFAPIITPQDPYRVNLRAVSQPPSWAHPLGTDTLGRDVLSRLIVATRVSLTVGFLSVLGYMVIGLFMGLMSGYYGKAVDAVLGRVTDAVLSFPPLVIVLVSVAVIGPGLGNLALAIILFRWPHASRIVRGEVLSLRERIYVRASRSIGSKTPFIISRHIIPNVIPTLTVAATFGLADVILLESGLSFLGAGVRPPMPSWGNMLMVAQSISVIRDMPWLWIPPGLMIILVVLSINFVGDGLRDALDPKTKEAKA